jgi:exodeoxyribonuclease-5
MAPWHRVPSASSVIKHRRFGDRLRSFKVRPVHIHEDARRQEAEREDRPTTKLIWSPQQVQALAAVESWRRDRSRPFFYLSGFAGTGKSTLAAEIAHREGDGVVFAAYTNKAAAVMRSKGCADATTIDSLIYIPELQASCAAAEPCKSPPCGKRCRYARERFVGRVLNRDSDVAYARLVVIDECSMVGAQMGNDLLSFAKPVLVLGDIAQLPSIGDGGFFTRRRPDFQLTEVHRQAFGSPIITLATRARQGLPLLPGSYGDSAVVDEISIKEMLSFDQIIVGTHRTRHRINKQIRKALGYGGAVPERGEKVLCLKNNRQKGLRNGTLWTVIEAVPADDGFIAMTVEDEEGLQVEVFAPVEGFSSRDASGSELPGQPFAYGYAITCHKSQGSQFDSVLVIDESAVFREDRCKWLYTAVTRAVSRVVVSS